MPFLRLCSRLLNGWRVEHDNPTLFVTSQWGVSLWAYPLYRGAVMLYLLITLLYTLAVGDKGVKWLVFVSHWTFLMLTLSSMVRFMTACFHVVEVRTARSKTSPIVKFQPHSSTASDSPLVIHSRHADGDASSTDDNSPTSRAPVVTTERLPFLIRVSWVLYNISGTASLLVTVMYWSVVFNETKAVTFTRVTVHAINTILVFLDLTITSLPHHFIHVYQPMLYSVVYSIFTVVYWAAGGTNHLGEPYVYSTFDFEHRPGLAVSVMAGLVLVATPCAHGVLYGVYCLRTRLLVRLWHGTGARGVQEAPKENIIC